MTDRARYQDGLNSLAVAQRYVLDLVQTLTKIEHRDAPLVRSIQAVGDCLDAASRQIQIRLGVDPPGRAQDSSMLGIPTEVYTVTEAGVYGVLRAQPESVLRIVTLSREAAEMFIAKQPRRALPHSELQLNCVQLAVDQIKEGSK